MNTIACTFRGRLDEEKGAHLILQSFVTFINQANHNRIFHIFGNGQYYDQCLALQQQYPDNLIVYGRSDRNTIKTTAKTTQYCLCPSTFLETFGLTALEGCKLGLPVIGQSKGGLTQFILDDIAQSGQSVSGYSLLNQLLYIDQHHDNNHHDREQQTLDIAQNYSPKHRLKQVQQLIAI